MEQTNFSQDQRLMSESIDQLATALSKAQGEFLIAIPSGINPRFKNRYCKMKDLVKASRPSLEKYGLSVNMQDKRDFDGKRLLITTILHNSGQWMRSYTLIDPMDEKNAQNVVGYDTYMGRKCYRNITGVVCDDDGDDDGESVVATPRNTSANGSDKVPKVIFDRLNSYSPAGKQKILNFNNINDLSELTVEQYDNMVKNKK